MKTKKTNKMISGLSAIRKYGLMREVMSLPEVRQSLLWAMMLSAILTAVLLFPVSNVIGTFCSAGTIGCALTMAMTASIMLIGGTVLLFLGFSMGLMVADVIILNVKK